MIPKIIKPDFSKEYFMPERCYILEMINRPDDSQLSIALARIKPGVTTVNHALDSVIERYLIISGTGFAEIGELSANVVSGDLVLIPADTPQKITNTGSDDLVFYCICTPPFAPECYRSLE